LVSCFPDSLIQGELRPWSFEVFALGLDIMLPSMTEENFKVWEVTYVLIVDPTTVNPLFDVTAEDV
jgi:hypothetical protein